MTKNTIGIQCTRDISTLKTDWKLLQEDGICTPYQQFDWISGYLKNLSASRKGEQLFVSLRREGNVVAILPLELSSRYGIRSLSWLGNKHFNYQGGLFDREFLQGLDEAGFRQLWKQIKSALPGFDLLCLGAQLQRTDGVVSPFSWLAAASSANQAHLLIYPHHDWPTLLAASRSRKTRKRMRNEESRLSREGNIGWKIIATPDEVDLYLPRLLAQRQERMNFLGIGMHEDPEAYFRFYGGLIKASLAQGNKSVRMIVLMLDDVLLSAIVLFTWRNTYYPLINSMTSSRYQTWSPGEYLLRIMMQLGCEENIACIDYGPGEDVYKTSWCNQKIPLYETIVAETARGYLALSGMRLYVWGKRSIKNNSALWGAYKSLRKQVGKTRSRLLPSSAQEV